MEKPVSSAGVRSGRGVGGWIFRDTFLNFIYRRGPRGIQFCGLIK